MKNRIVQIFETNIVEPLVFAHLRKNHQQPVTHMSHGTFRDVYLLWIQRESEKFSMETTLKSIYRNANVSPALNCRLQRPPLCRYENVLLIMSAMDEQISSYYTGYFTVYFLVFLKSWRFLNLSFFIDSNFHLYI